MPELYKLVNFDECDFLPDEKLPALVLATIYEYPFTDQRKWMKIVHQVGGGSCIQHYMIATILNPKPEIRDAMQQISDWGLSSCLNDFLETKVEYRNELKRLLNVDCNHSYAALDEGIYPIDCSVENLRTLCTDELPDDLDEFIDWSKQEKGIRIDHAAWRVYILGPQRGKA